MNILHYALFASLLSIGAVIATTNVRQSLENLSIRLIIICVLMVIAMLFFIALTDTRTTL